MTLTESIVKETALERFRDLSYALGHGPDIAPGEGVAERDWFEEVMMRERLRAALRQINPTIPDEARDETLKKVRRLDFSLLVSTNPAPSPICAIPSPHYYRSR
jgi:type I restriction enzyme R subunit